MVSADLLCVLRRPSGQGTKIYEWRRVKIRKPHLTFYRLWTLIHTARIWIVFLEIIPGKRSRGTVKHETKSVAVNQSMSSVRLWFHLTGCLLGGWEARGLGNLLHAKFVHESALIDFTSEWIPNSKRALK